MATIVISQMFAFTSGRANGQRRCHDDKKAKQDQTCAIMPERRTKRTDRPRPMETTSTPRAPSPTTNIRSTIMSRLTSQLSVSAISSCVVSDGINDDDDDTTYSSPCENIATRGLAVKTAEAATRVVRDVFDNSKVLSSSSFRDVPRFDANEIGIGKRLGRGGFSDVLEISHIEPINTCLNIDQSEEQRTFKWSRPSFLASFTEDDIATVYVDQDDKKQDHTRSQEEETSRQGLAESAATGSQLCLKLLRRKTLEEPHLFKIGAMDLVAEAAFLSSLDHPNIIKLRGLSSHGPRGFASGTPSGYFLIIDRLHGTLDERIRAWRDQAAEEGLDTGGGSISSRLKSKLSRGKRCYKKSRAALADRLRVAPDIASALVYLHSKGVLYRDLKPSNVGFDSQGRVQLFDFGLAKEVNSLDAGNDGTYLLSGNTGSPRFMAPEVARFEPYNFSADCYSFALVLWQILTSSRPYEGMNRHAHTERVVYGIERPYLPPAWPDPLRELLKLGWHPNLLRRPNMKAMHHQLCLVLGRLDGSSADTCTTNKHSPSFKIGDARARAA